MILLVNPNDLIRDIILRELYEIHQNSRGIKSIAIGIKDLQKRLKPKGFKQQDVSGNLDYLVQKSWVKEITQERKFTTKGGTERSAEQTTYKISDIGIDKLEGASIYRREPITPSINITNIDGVTVIGDGNIINMDYKDLNDALSELRNEISESDEIQDEIKLDTISDIDSIKSQLQKPNPNKSIIGTIWNGVKTVASIEGLSEAVSKVTNLISKLI